MERLEGELDNLRAALDWSLQHGHGEMGLRMGTALALFWKDRAHLSEGRRWLDLALAASPDAGAPLRAKELRVAGMSARVQGDYEPARARLEESARLYREMEDRQGAAIVSTYLGGLARLQGDFDRAAQLLEESLPVHRELDDHYYLPTVFANLGEVRMRQGDYAEGRAMLEEALAIRRDDGDIVAAGENPVALGRGEHARGDLDQAARFFRDGLDLLREMGAVPSMVDAIHGLAPVLAEGGLPLQAARL